MSDVKINFTFEKIKFTPIEGSNYFHQIDLLYKVCNVILDLYSGMFNIENDIRIKFDATEKYIYMRKLQIFE